VLGALSALLGRQRAIGVFLFLESPEERFTRGAARELRSWGAGPRDFRCSAPVDVLGYVASPPPRGSRRPVVVPIIASAALTSS